MSITVWSRHDLVWLHPCAVERAVPVGPLPIDPALALHALADWIARGFPLIVARQDVSDNGCATGLVRVGLAEPAQWGKRKLAFLVHARDVDRHSQPIGLACALPRLPRPWQAGCRALLAHLQRADVHAAVYGSAALQVHTGVQFTHAESDLDLLFSPAAWPSVTALLAALHRVSNDYPELRIDGEIVNPYGEYVAWRELAAGSPQVMVKTQQEVRLTDFHQYKQSFFEWMPTSCATV